MVVLSHHLHPSSSRSVKVIHGANDGLFLVAGVAVATIRASLKDAFNIPDEAVPFVNGETVSPAYQLQENDTLEFVKRRGRKSVGNRVWTDEAFSEFFQITREDLNAWIAQGLKVKRSLDGSLRITETAVDEFFRGQVIESPYLNTEQAAAYCNISKDAFYGRVERKKIKPLPGSGKENIFTREQCDKMMKGE